MPFRPGALTDSGFQRLDPGEQRARMDGGLGTHYPQQGHLQHEPLFPSLPYLDQGVAQLIDDPVDVGYGEDPRSILPGFHNLGRLVGGRTRIREMVSQEDPPEEPYAFGDEGAEVDSPAIQAGYQGQHRCGIPICDRLGQNGHRIAVSHSQGPFHSFGIDSSVAKGGDLLQETERVADAPTRMAGNGLQAVRGHFVALAAGDRPQMAGQNLRRDGKEVKTLATGADGVQ